MPCRISLPKGGFDFNKLNIKDKILMSLLRLKLKMKKRHGQELSDDEKGMLAVYETAVDFTKRKAIEPIVESVREYLAEST